MSDELKNDFYLHGTASNFSRTSKTSQIESRKDVLIHNKVLLAITKF